MRAGVLFGCGFAALGPYRVRIDNLLSMFLRPDFECLQQLVNLILDRLMMRALVARRTAPQGPLFRAQSRKSVESTSVGSLRRARIFWTSLRHLGRLTDVARASVSGRTCELRLNDIHGTNAEISPDFQMVSRSGQALGPHPYQPLK